MRANVWKFPITAGPGEVAFVLMPEGSAVLTVESQGDAGELFLWATVPEGSSNDVERWFAVVHTGQAVVQPAVYIGTVFNASHDYVRHVFELVAPREIKTEPRSQTEASGSTSVGVTGGRRYTNGALRERCAHHAPRTEAEVDAHRKVRELIANAMVELNDLLVEGESKQRALEALELARLHANTAVALDGVLLAPKPPENVTLRDYNKPKPPKNEGGRRG